METLTKKGRKQPLLSSGVTVLSGARQVLFREVHWVRRRTGIVCFFSLTGVYLVAANTNLEHPLSPLLSPTHKSIYTSIKVCSSRTCKVASLSTQLGQISIAGR
jgi:hypothetical protein